MLDRTIPFFNTILKCTHYDFKQIVPPDSYKIISYKNGFENDWARLEYSAGDFDSKEEGVNYFCDKYLKSDSFEDILFLLDKNDKVIGSCIAWSDLRDGKEVNSLHWLIVDKDYQGKKLGRLLCQATMNRFYQKGGNPIYIHTQPWSWKAILLYVSLGFKLQKTDTFASYTNQYQYAMETLEKVLTREQFDLLKTKSED